jgi:hypothetical protein
MQPTDLCVDENFLTDVKLPDIQSGDIIRCQWSDGYWDYRLVTSKEKFTASELCVASGLYFRNKAPKAYGFIMDDKDKNLTRIQKVDSGVAFELVSHDELLAKEYKRAVASSNS